MKKKLVFFFILFWIFSLADIAALYVGENAWHNLIKPVLIPTLMLPLLFGKIVSKFSHIILLGLFFSFCGDLFLLYDEVKSNFFIYGLICFLLTHIIYIIYFNKIKPTQQSLLRKYPWIAALVAAYGVSLVQFLYPHLGAMKIPVIIYALVICIMFLYSLHAFVVVNKPANSYFVLGALFFVSSDSLLAINKFYTPFNYAGIWIMLTYCAAQFFIVLAVCKRVGIQNEK